MNNNQGSGPVLVDAETRDLWNTSRMLADDSRRNTSMRESSEIPTMHIYQNTKRQNCGVIPRHHNPPFPNSSQGVSGYNVVNAECEVNVNQLTSTSSGFYGARNHRGRMPDFRQFSTGSLDAGNINVGSFQETYWNTGLPGYEERIPYYPVGSSFMLGNDHPHLGRMPCKRKSSMLDSSSSSLDLRPSGIWNNDVARFTEASGASRGSTGSAMFSESSVIPELLNPRGNDGIYQPDRMNSLHYLQSDRNYDRNLFTTRETHPASVPCTRGTSASHPSQMWMSRRIPTNENILESSGYHDVSPDSSLLSQNVGATVDATWVGNSTFMRQLSNNPGYSVTPRDLNSGSGIVNPVRHYLGGSVGQHGILPGECILQNAVEPLTRTSLSISRTLPIRDPVLNLPHLPSNHYVYPGSGPLRSNEYTLGTSSNRRINGSMLPYPSASCGTPSNSTQRSLGAYGDAYPAFPSAEGPVMASILPGSVDVGRTSPLPNLYRMPFRGIPVISAERVNRQRLSHDFVEHDQHSNMRLDVDNMSYEELLALEERIGNVNTGLSEDIIQKCLQVIHYSSLEATSAIISQENEVKCSICQEEYSDGDKVGQLECGHGYHTGCIKQWLMLKNLCPICKCSAHPAS